MMEKEKKEKDNFNFRKGDLFAIVFVAVLAISVMMGFMPQNLENASEAQIYLDGKLIKTVSLNKDQTFSVEDEYFNEITVKDGTISFTDSSCPGQDCVHSGSIHKPGRSLVCLPNKVEIRVISEESDVDFVVG